MSEHLSVCFLWHMHQPLYKDRLSGDYLMPWVRLHAIKDYLDMPMLLNEFPRVRQTFNLVPSLIEQLEDYGFRDAQDEQLRLTLKDAEQYTDQDKLYILSESFHANLERQIKVHPPYMELYLRRQKLLKPGKKYAEILHQFNNQDYADMATWLNLAWFDPLWHEKASGLRELINQGSNFTTEQRRHLIETERGLMRKIVSVYKELQELGRIEVTTSPYYHPILPLLIDSNTAKLANPYTSLPEKVYLYEEDAKHQIDTSLTLYEEKFGKKANGMWPSELSVSAKALQLIAGSGVNWVVLDEALLSKTKNESILRDELGNLESCELLCQPYELMVGDQSIQLFFREVVLSNEISFSYASRTAQEAASNMYMRLKHIQQKLFNWPREGVVVIALDGENCWETYEQDGNIFLRELYRRLSEDNTLNVCTISDYLRRNPPTERLYNIHPGSWISADFHIWIGDPLKNKAWDLLWDTRRFLVEQIRSRQIDKEAVARAWEEIYAAEGSDWFWWFGEPNNAEHDAMFDQQFRIRLQNVYRFLEKPYPKKLDVPIHDLVYAQDRNELVGVV